ncbi:hypothetical protein OV450_8077 [Actinobacteria bacterium OV450]|nr:hypothetical protein OV450_8077 [Actinobacteria bacterium OV450]
MHTAHYGLCARFVGHHPSLTGGTDDALTTLTRLHTHRSRLLNQTP